MYSSWNTGKRLCLLLLTVHAFCKCSHAAQSMLPAMGQMLPEPETELGSKAAVVFVASYKQL